jgi:hypothetical protein
MAERHGADDGPAYCADGLGLRDRDGAGNDDYEDESEHSFSFVI